MAQLDDISLAIGRLQATTEQVAANQHDHQYRDDARHDETQRLISQLTEHVNHENELMVDRLESLERAREASKARRHQIIKALEYGGGLLAFIIGNVILFLSGTYEHFFGGH